MIELLKYLANNLGPEDLLRLAQFLSKNPQIIDEKTLLEIINDVNDFEMQTLPEELNEKLNKIQEHFKEMDQHEELHRILKDNNIGLN